jgi:tetratricopeptide (TPR) repeat protein
MTAEQYKAKGNDAFKAKNYREAIDWYTRAIDLDPASESAGALYSNRAASWSGLNDHTKALADGELCVRVRPDWLKGHFRKGVALEALNRLDEAQKAFQDALKTEPANAEVQDKLQQLNARIKERNEKAKPSTCSTAEEAKILGNSHFGQGKYEQAAGFYTRAIELSAKMGDANKTDLANYYSNRAACHQQVHNYKAVIADCNEALAIDANHSKALLRRAIAFEGLEKWQQALDDYNSVNRISPGMQNVSQGVLRCQRALRAS